MHPPVHTTRLRGYPAFWPYRSRALAAGALRACVLVGALVVAVPRQAAAQIQAVETPSMRLEFTSPLQSYLIPQIAGSFENSLRFHRRLFDYKPSGKINVLVHDLWHYGNAGARPVPENNVTVGISPYSHEYESAPAPERMASSMNHELAHIVTTDKATKADGLYRRLFSGKVTPNPEAPLSMAYSYLTTPRWYTPRWYLEGIATYLETWMNGGLGRAIGPYDEMVFRTIVRDSGTIYDVVGLESEGTTIDFQVGANSYLYGTRFISYLGLRYGNDSLLAWVNRTEGSKRYFSSQFRHVYGRSLEDEWSRWIDWEREWQRDNLAAIRRHPVTRARPLTARVLGSVSRPWYDADNGRIYVAVRYPGQEAHIAAIDVASGNFTRITAVRGAAGLSVTSLVFDAGSRTLFYTTNNADWRHLVAFDLATGRSRMLIRNARIGDLAFDAADRSLWGVRHDNGFSTIVRVPYPYDEWNQVHTLPYGQDVFDLDVSPDGTTLVASMSEVSGDQRLVRMNIQALRGGDTTHQVLYEFGNWAASNFVFSRDGRYLVGSSYYSGVSNIFRYDLVKGRMQPLSNAETGFFKPLLLSQDSVLVFAYSRQGFVPSMIPNAVPDSISAIRFLGNEIAERRPVVQEWMPPPVSALGKDSAWMAAVPYRTFRNFKLDNAYPIVEGYEDASGNYAVAGGMRLNFSDRIGATTLDLTSSYSPEQRLESFERVHLHTTFRYWNWKLSGALNRADFYDLFGPTKMSRRGYSAALQYQRNILLDGSTSLGYTLRVAGYAGLATIPEFQNVPASSSQLASFFGELAYANLRRSLGAVDDELGVTWAAALHDNHTNGASHPRLSFDVARGILLPVDHSSLWLRASSGIALAGRRDNPFSRFYFGGFGNNWVDYRIIKQFRNAESFPGLGINEVGGASYAKGQVEWVSPPLRFRRVGIPSAYLRWADVSLFGTGLVTDFEDAATRTTVGGAGAQVDFRLVTLSHLDSTFSWGYALAWGGGVPRRRGLMFSIKLT